MFLDAYASAKFLCEAYYMAAPKIKIESVNGNCESYSLCIYLHTLHNVGLRHSAYERKYVAVFTTGRLSLKAQRTKEKL